MEIENRTIKYRIIRKTSPYNKYIKWFLETYRDDGSLLSSSGYKTEFLARNVIKNDKSIPLGNKLIFIHYEEMDGAK